VDILQYIYNNVILVVSWKDTVYIVCTGGRYLHNFVGNRLIDYLNVCLLLQAYACTLLECDCLLFSILWMETTYNVFSPV
jgi:hypothetical protein